MWTKADSGKGLNWEQSLAYAATLKLTGHADWRLPNAKELQSIVDCTRIPACTPLFQTTKLSDGEYPFYWSSTTHLDGPPDRQGRSRRFTSPSAGALGWMQFPTGRGEFQLLDVHGAGARRSDPKAGDPAAFPAARPPRRCHPHLQLRPLCAQRIEVTSIPNQRWPLFTRYYAVD